jgi:hypothetical protein
VEFVRFVVHSQVRLATISAASADPRRESPSATSSRHELLRKIDTVPCNHKPGPLRASTLSASTAAPGIESEKSEQRGTKMQDRGWDAASSTRRDALERCHGACSLLASRNDQVSASAAPARVSSFLRRRPTSQETPAHHSWRS